MNLSNVFLQDLPLDILLEIARLHPWVGCELSKTVRRVGLFSLDHDAKRWYKVEENKETFILVKFSKEPYCQRLYHSWDDSHAKINSYGVQEWYKKGNLHREKDKPAVIFPDGGQMWFKEGMLHRDNDLPAIIGNFGGKEWFKEGKRHRDDDKPAIIYFDGSPAWYKNGELYSHE